MNQAYRNSIDNRRFRLIQAAMVAGMVALGSLVVDRLVEFFREGFFLFYGIPDTEFSQLEHIADARLPLTVGQLIVALTALIMVIVFVAAERYRLRQYTALRSINVSKSSAVVSKSLSLRDYFDLYVLRTSSFAGLLLSLWLLQSSLERWLGGYGLGIEYASWHSLLPLASVFGVCVLVGMFVALISMVGMRAIHVLELALNRLKERKPKLEWKQPSGHDSTRLVRTIRELLGCEILSRPPPLLVSMRATAFM